MPKDKALAGEGKGRSGFYETFDSGDGPTVPEGMQGDFAHHDSDGGLESYTSNPVSGLDTEVPEVPAKKR